MEKVNCQCCSKATNDFVLLNETCSYSGIEMALNRQGMLRVRYYTEGDIWFSEDIINVEFCPVCGKRFMKG